MRVSFHGIKNIGAAVEFRNKPEIFNASLDDKKDSRIICIPEGKSLELHCELDNEGTKDLDEFKILLDKYPNKDKMSKNVLNVSIDRISLIGNSEEKIPVDICIVNGHIVPLKHKNQKAVKKLKDLSEKISLMNQQDLKYDDYYLSSKSCRNSYSYYFEKFSSEPSKLLGVFEQFFNPANIKIVSGIVASDLRTVLKKSKDEANE